MRKKQHEHKLFGPDTQRDTPGERTVFSGPQKFMLGPLSTSKHREFLISTLPSINLSAAIRNNFVVACSVVRGLLGTGTPGPRPRILPGRFGIDSTLIRHRFPDLTLF